jgi:hypothetical protein
MSYKTDILGIMNFDQSLYIWMDTSRFFIKMINAKSRRPNSKSEIPVVFILHYNQAMTLDEQINATG